MQAFSSRNVPAISFDYKVENTTLPNTYICPHAFSSDRADISISDIQVFCKVSIASQNAVLGERATGLRAPNLLNPLKSFATGPVNWAMGNANRVAPRTFTYADDSDCEVTSVEVPIPDILDTGIAGLSYMCFKFNTSRFTYTPAFISTDFNGVEVTLIWRLANASASLNPLNPYLRGGNFQVSMSDNVFSGEQVAGNSVGAGSSTVVLSTTNRRLLDGSQVRSDSRTPARGVLSAWNPRIMIRRC